MTNPRRPVALITGASRPAGLGAAIALALADSGWDIAITYWTPYDGHHPWPQVGGPDVDAVLSELRARGARTFHLEADLADAAVPERLFAAAEDALGPISGLVANHCECEPSDLVSTTVESFDQHYFVNVRATWLLLRQFATRYTPESGPGRAVVLTSDHIIGNLPYGATKAAANAVALQAAAALGPQGVTVNAINPGPNDTGWFTEAVAGPVRQNTYLPRLGQPSDTANLVRFLFSPEGEWITGQLLHSNGGFRPTAA